MSAVVLARLTLRARRKRILALLAFAGVFLAAGVTARLLVTDEGGHVNADQLFLLGGYPAVSALLLLGWVLGRFPLIATLVLMAGLVSDDRAEGYARVYAVRPASPLRTYGTRFAVLAGVAFAISAVLMPTFDLLMLGTWAGPATLVLILSYVLVFGGLVALLSVWTRGDAWIALLLAIAALVWDAMRSAGSLANVPPGVRDVVTFILPPQALLFSIEEAFGSIQPIPWDAFLYVAGYGVTLLALAAVALHRREV
ncbi:MAG TPA: hypothetical protein VF212_15055 [Longimicrobiales bacterium]